MKFAHGGISHFFTLSAGITKVQKTQEASPPDKKLEKPVLICWNVINVLVFKQFDRDPPRMECLLVPKNFS